MENLLISTEDADSQQKFQDHEFERVFNLLDSAENRDDQRLMQLEWQFLRALEHTKRGPRALFESSTNDPAFFVLLISWIYRSDKEEDRNSETLSDEARRNRSQQADHLLSCWEGIPGRVGDEFDESKLNSWIHETRTRLAATGHRQTGDRSIGEVLARAPEGDGGVWPTTAVRNVLERLRSRGIERGLDLVVINSRGVVARGTGGAQERDLETRYREMSVRCSASWPRTANVLASIADHYASEARHWDDDAERNDLRYG